MKIRTKYLIIGTISMVIYGLMYNWTVYTAFVQHDLGCNSSALQMVFSLCQIGFTCGGITSGFLYKKVNYNVSMLVITMILVSGLLISSMANNVIWIYIGYGLMFNFSNGFAYESLLTAIIGWFPDKSGFASGVLFMGTGLSAFIFNVPTTYIIQAIGWRNSMRILAVLAFILSATASIIIKKNDKPYLRKEIDENEIMVSEDVNTKDMLKSPKFYSYFLWSVLLLASCTSITGNAVSVSKSIGLKASLAAALSMIISLCNSMSRIVYGTIFDKKGRAMAMNISTLLFVISVICLFCSFITGSTILMIVSFACVGLSFGAIPSVSSAYILKTFGNKYYPSNFAIQGTYSFFSSLLGTTLLSAIFAKTNSYPISYRFLIVYAIIIIILLNVNHSLFRKKKINNV